MNSPRITPRERTVMPVQGSIGTSAAPRDDKGADTRGEDRLMLNIANALKSTPLTQEAVGLMIERWEHVRTSYAEVTRWNYEGRIEWKANVGFFLEKIDRMPDIHEQASAPTMDAAFEMIRVKYIAAVRLRSIALRIKRESEEALAADAATKDEATDQVNRESLGSLGTGTTDPETPDIEAAAPRDGAQSTDGALSELDQHLEPREPDAATKDESVAHLDQHLEPREAAIIRHKGRPCPEPGCNGHLFIQPEEINTNVPASVYCDVCDFQRVGGSLDIEA